MPGISVSLVKGVTCYYSAYYRIYIEPAGVLDIRALCRGQTGGVNIIIHIFEYYAAVYDNTYIAAYGNQSFTICRVSRNGGTGKAYSHMINNIVSAHNLAYYRSV